ncbi:tubulin epsilon and delta complex protein 2 isoform 2-T2 [Spinachia spinachia]
MPLLSLVEQAIKSCKAEQTKINDSIRFYKDLLQTLTPRPKTGFDQTQCANNAATATDSSPGEKEDIELLERALEKALRVRTGAGYSKKDSSKRPCTTAVARAEGALAPAASKVDRSTSRPTSKSANPKEPKRPAGVAHRQAAGKPQQAHPGQLHTASLHSKKKTVRSDLVSARDPGEAVAPSAPCDNPVSLAEGLGARCLLGPNGKASEQIAIWKSLRRKQNRLWDQVVALQRKPVPGRSHFMERLRATFHRGPLCRIPDQTGLLVDRPTPRGPGLDRRCQTAELRARRTQEAATELAWETWDRWRTEGGRLCPAGVNGAGVDEMIAPLPPTLTYATEAELVQLETLRMRGFLLRQEIYLEQAILDTLSPLLPSIIHGPGCPDPSVLRDLYSLLGEGGERFPAVVLDSEP